jgi:hypothetical protein
VWRPTRSEKRVALLPQAGAGSFADAFVSISIDPGVNAKRGPIINIDAGDDATIAGGTSTSSGFCDPLASSGS